MLYLTKNQSNSVTMQLRDVATFATPVFLLIFKNEITRQTDEIVLDDESLHPDWVQKFTIVMPDDLNLPAGDYFYQAYEEEGEERNLLKVGLARILP